ncbi:YfhO family protein [Flavobacteriaceae bacterium]|nr:YfhO family protein [Flavobacteriaceae bacterium]MDC0554097.1 YfhO family protein [Flavobacteriaceae bacterium]
MKDYLTHLVCVLILTLISVTYFYPVLSNKSIQQSDISQFSGMSKQIVDHRENFNEEPYWLDNAFLGMPSYQVSAKYPFDLLYYIDQAVRFLPRPADYLFLYLLSFYFLIISLNINYRYALFGAIAFGFSTYLIIILGVGHNTKALALGYLPFVVAGFLMILRGNYLKGFLISSLFLGLQVHANHYQMTYYTLIMLLVLVLVHYYDFLKSKELKKIYKSFFVLISVGLLALLMNSPSLLATKEYSEFSTRSKSDITINADGSAKESLSGLDKEYITEYSYGVLESLNLIFPRFMGGGSSERIREDSKLMNFIRSLDANQAQQVYQYSKVYWGNQPIVAAPAYIGISLFFIFLLSILLVNDLNRKWILIAISISLFLSWGKNFSFLTDLMIDYFPLYDKFRAVSSIQIIIEFCIPLFAVMGLSKFFSNNTKEVQKLNSLKYASVFLVSLILVFYFFGTSILDFKSDFEIFSQYPEILNLLIEERQYVFKSDVLRSLIIVVCCFITFYLFVKKIIKKDLTFLIITLIVIFDLWIVDKNYVNSDQFVKKSLVEIPFQKTIADKAILKDDSDFRVFEPMGGFSNARTSYFHKSIAGYHAAKPKRIQNLYDFYISKNNFDVLNMLNVKYIIQNSEDNPLGVTRNPNNLGNAWFVENIINVKNSDEELLGLKNIDLSNTCLSQNTEIINTSFQLNETNEIKLISRKANQLIYSSKTDSNQFAVFSEAFYNNGWQAYVDNKPVSHFKVNYLLRGMEMPKGTHEIKFEFKPAVINTGFYLSLLSYLIFISLFIKFIVIRKDVQ